MKDDLAKNTSRKLKNYELVQKLTVPACKNSQLHFITENFIKENRKNENFIKETVPRKSL